MPANGRWDLTRRLKGWTSKREQPVSHTGQLWVQNSASVPVEIIDIHDKRLYVNGIISYQIKFIKPN